MSRIVKIFLASFLFLVFFQNSSGSQTVFPPFEYLELSGPTDKNISEYLKVHNFIVIKIGTGGRVYGMIDTLKFLRSNPTKFILIDGPCYSACTLLLSSKHNVIITKRARFFFHSATNNICENKKTVQTISIRANRDMLALFRSQHRKWIRENQAFGSTEFVEMPKQLVEQIYSDMMLDIILDQNITPPIEKTDGGDVFDACAN